MSEKQIINLNEILELIPHRYPFLLVEKIIDYKEDEYAIGIKNFTINEPFFQGHFPNNPIVPGVYIIESMAQTAAVLAIKSMHAAPNTKGVLFAGIESAKFKKPVLPSDRLELHVKVLKKKMNIFFIEGKGYVDGNLVAETVFSAVINDIKK